MTLSSSDLDSLAHDLAHPPLRLDVRELAQIWTYDRIRAICPKPKGLEDYPELSLRVRGAFGRALYDLPARFTKTGFERARAWDVLFAPIAMHAAGREIPRPAIVRAQIVEGHLIVDMHVFGDAMAWSEDAALALLLALRGGINLSSVGGIKVAIEPDDILTSRITGVAVPDAVNWAAMHARTPIRVRHGSSTSGDPLALARACIRRISAMARWQGVDLAEDFEALAGIHADPVALYPFRWSRHSIRQGNTAIPMAGHLGRLTLSGALHAFMPWACLAATCNTGSHAGLGLGWFDLAY